jgi:hypothetical protein
MASTAKMTLICQCCELDEWPVWGSVLFEPRPALPFLPQRKPDFAGTDTLFCEVVLGGSTLEGR